MHQRAYSLCDMDIDILNDLPELHALADRLEREGIGIVYVGSCLCAEYFIAWWRSVGRQELELLEKRGLRCIMCLPVPAENRLAEVCEIAREACADFEKLAISVSDYGMLNWITANTKCDIMLGRLFMRNTRDPRFIQLGKEHIRIPFSADTLRALYDNGNGRVKGIEMEGYGGSIDASALPAGMILGLHTPWIQMSCDRICTDASLDKPLEDKFRPDAECGLGCRGVIRRYDFKTAQSYNDGGRPIARNDEGIRETYVIKKGRGIFFCNDSVPAIVGAADTPVLYIEKEF